MVKWFCSHRWEITGTDYHPPTDQSIKQLQEIALEGKASRDMVDKYPVQQILFGTTFIHMKCIDCGWIKEDSVLGKYNE